MRLAIGGAAVLAVLGLAGCGPSATPAEQRAGDSILLAAPEDPGGSMDALIQGTLTRSDEGCLTVETSHGTFVLQFPFGSRLADDGESVEVPGAGTLRLGDDVDGVGGYIDVPDTPEECRLSAEFAVWQTVAD